jgi:tRNA threonylcarbamoyl adenosine modification protein YeaZ
MPTDGPLLAIESSNPTSIAAEGCGAGVGVYVQRDSVIETLAHAPLEAGARHDDALMALVDRACAQARISPAALQSVAVSLGPGGYTACRIAATVGQCVARALAIPCLGVPTALALASAHALHDAAVPPIEAIAVLLAWKRQDVWRQVYVRGPDEALAIAREGELVPIHDPLHGMPAGRVAVIAEDAIIERATAGGWNPSGASATVFAPRFDPRSVAEAALAWLVQPVPPAQLLPLYPREPEAVTKWEALARARARGS